MSAHPPAVLLSGDPIAVSVARSLAADGARVHVLGVSDAPVRRSRACQEFVDVVSNDGVQDRYLEWLRDRAPRGAAVLPCDDHSLELVARERDRLLEWGLAPIELDPDVALAMLDKERTYALCRGIGVPAPRTAAVRTEEELEGAIAGTTLPCAVKPVRAHAAARLGFVEKVTVAGTQERLREVLAPAVAAGAEMLVSEIVEGGDDQLCSFYSYLDPDGRPLFRLVKRTLRQFPAGFGLTTYHATACDPEVAELGERFFAGVGLRGVGNVQFKRHARDGRWRIIECNHRFTAANELVRRAGIDVGLLAYRRAVGLPDPPLPADYRRGLHMWHPVEDARAFLAQRRDGTLSGPAWLRSLARRQVLPMARWDDPGPTLANAASRARAVRRRLSRAPR